MTRVIGIAEREYMRRPSPPRRSSLPLLAVLGAVGLLVLAFGLRPLEWVREHVPGRECRGCPGQPIRIPARDDPWKAFLAPESACPGRYDVGAPAPAQERTAMCMLNFARFREGLPPLRESALLSRASALKAADIARCDDFAHAACGKDPAADARAAGFRGRGWGENIFSGPGPYKSPLAAVDGWLNSPHHRENLFRRAWTIQGIALLHADRLESSEDVAVWVSEFGRQS